MSISGLSGQKLAGMFLLHTPIAHGAHGVVYEAQNQFTGQRLAVKVFHPEVLDQKGLARMRRDAEMAAALHHPGIVRVVEWSRRDVLPMVYVVTELLDGECVQSRVRRHGRLSPTLVLELGLRVSLTLSAAHKLGVVHRGLTPRNLMYARPDADAVDQGETVKILDFGVAHLPGLPWLLHDALPYRARELDESAEVDGRADQFALASILYEALTGRVPPLHDEVELEHEGELRPPPPLSILCPEAPRHMVEAIERAMSPMREDRYSSLSDFARALEDRRVASWRSTASLRPFDSSLSSARSLGSGSGASRVSGVSFDSGTSAASGASPGSRAASGSGASQVAPASSGTLPPAAASQHTAPRSSSVTLGRLQAVSGTTRPPFAHSATTSSLSSGKLRALRDPAGEPPAGDAAVPGRSASSQLPPRSAQSMRGVPMLRSGESTRPGSAHTFTPVVRPSSASSQKLGKGRTMALGLGLAATVALYVGTGGHGRDGEAITTTARPHELPVMPLLPHPAATLPLDEADEAQLDLEAALTEAEEVLEDGDNARAIELARVAIPSSRAWQVIATAACRMEDGPLHNEALSHLTEMDRRRVETSCTR